MRQKFQNQKPKYIKNQKRGLLTSKGTNYQGILTR